MGVTVLGIQHNFYPRSPCGERLVVTAFPGSADNFYPRSPCGERQFSHQLIHHQSVFLSTLSLRRATTTGKAGDGAAHNFYPRSPCGERPALPVFLG